MAEQPSSAEAVTEGAPELLPKEKDSEGGEGGNEQGQQGKASEGEERASESPCETESQRAVMKSSDKPLKGSNSGTLAAESPVVNNLLLPYLGFLKSMASSPHFDDQDFDFEGGFSGTRSAEKRPSPDYDDEYYDNDPFAPKKAKSKAEEAASGVTTGMILSLRESLQNCKDTLLTCQNELEAAKSEIHKWRTAFQNEPFIPSGTTPAPKLAINYLQALKSSEESLKEQSAVRDLKAQLKPATMQARRLLLDPAVHEEFTRLKNLVEEKDKKMKELQDNIAAINFTPQSKMGKMLMAKCKTLQEENEEIGNQATDAKIQELAMKLSLQKYQNAELRSQFEGLQTHMDGLTNDVERSNEMVLMLQEKLEDKDQEIQRLKDELQEKGFMDEGTTEAASKERCH
ncbi:FKBP12-interacting protein of 37 kDa isoform X3 [Arachis ipaensis]|uniref:FKBP12-interacting protein of 37 kDa isoform X3 n=1 Tax=Arachis ipaensis TaxID=130454 RepID=UPI0007AFA4DD|nr:FKBP12-interacting protein of 37 kDa isoform X3 [Arachis ipaensis]